MLVNFLGDKGVLIFELVRPQESKGPYGTLLMIYDLRKSRQKAKLNHNWKRFQVEVSRKIF